MEMADIKNFGIVGVGSDVQFGKGGGTFKWDTDGFISTSNGTTLADLDAATMNFTGLSGTGAVTVTDILDEDNMASDSATALATQQSIKAYVDSQVGATTLNGTGDSGTFTVDLDSDTFGVLGGTNITSTGTGTNVTLALDGNISVDSVSVTNFVNTRFLTLDNINVNASGTEINYLDGSTPGTATVNNAVVLDANKDITGINELTATTVNFDNLSGTGAVSVTDILDDDTMATASATTLATSESVKAYVDAQVTAADLDFAGDSGTGSVDLDTQVFTIAGGIGLTSTGSGQQVEIRLNNTAVTAGTYGDATNIPQFTVDQQGRITASSNVAIQTAWTLAGDSGSEVVNGGDTATIAGGTNITTVASATDTLTVNLDTTLTGMAGATFSGTVDANTVEFDNLSGTGAVSVTDILDDDTMATASATTLATSESTKAYVDTVAAGVVSDGNINIQGDSGTGSVNFATQSLDVAGGLNLTSTASGQEISVAMDTTLTGMTAATFSGTVQAGTLTDGTASINGGAITGATDITATGTIQGGTLTDGTASISSGALTGGTTGSFSGTVTAGNLNASGGLVTFNQLSDGTLTMDAILDEDNMVSDSATAIPTQQSVKAYVDSEITSKSTEMNMQGDTGTGSIVFQTETLDIAGTANEIETSFDNGTNTLTVGLTDDVTITGNLGVGGSLNSDDITAENISVNGDVTIFGDTVMEGNLTVQGNTTIVNSNTITTGDNIITLNADLPGNVVPVANMGLEMNRGSESNVTILWVEATDTFTFGNEDGGLEPVKAKSFEGADFTGANVAMTGDVSFGTLTDSGESITVTKFVDEADGLANNDNDTSIPTTAAVIDYVDTNAGDGNLIRNGAIGNGAQSVVVGTVPSNPNRIYYLLKVVVKVTVGYSGNSVDHIIVREDGGLGTQIVTDIDADALNTGTYIIEGDGATTLENGETILLAFRDSSNNLVAPTAGAMSVSVFYGWEEAGV
jgi:hypothetical protein